MNDTKYDLQARPVNEMKFSYGGQAVIEGVMMRGAHIFAVAVRAPDGGIVVHEQPLNKALYHGRIAKLPFVRGLVGLWDSLGLGTRALMWSADMALTEDEQPETDVPKTILTQIATFPLRVMMGVQGDSVSKRTGKSIDFNGPVGWATVAFSLILGLGLFMVVPTATATFIAKLIGIDSLLTLNLIEGVVQLGILIGYISLIGLMPDTKRLFGYHGAEHKTINAYEAGAELTPEVVAQYPIEHPRCGTAFLLTVAFVGMLVFAVVDTLFTRQLITRIILIPAVAGISYEILRFTAENISNPIIRIITIPNLALQHLTTRQPDLTMIEVAIVAFKRVLVAEGIVSAEEASVPAAAQPTAVPALMPAGD